MAKLRLSYSSLQYFYESGCPAAWKFREEIRPKAINPFASMGILVHSIMAMEKQITDVPEDQQKTALMYVTKLNELYKVAGITIKRREFWREVDIMLGVQWVSKIDFDGYDPKGLYIIGDWKTTGNGWKGINTPLGDQIKPVARSFQSSGYLTRGNEKKWPRTLLYIIVGFRGPGEVVRYNYNKADNENLLEAIKNVKAQKRFPKVYGKHCLGTKPDGSDRCEFFSACFKTKGWQDEYTARDKV